MIILTKNKVFNLAADDITASSEAEEYEADRLLSATPAKTWRTTGVADETLALDFGAAVEIDSVALIAHNFTSDAVIKIQADSSDGFPDPEEETLTWNAGRIVKFFTAKTKRYWRLAVQDATNTNGYLKLGILLLGKRIELTAELPRGWQRSRKDPSVIVEGAGGQEFVRLRTGYDEYALTFSEMNPLSNADFTALEALIGAVGTSRYLLLSLQQGAEIYDHTLYGRFSNISDFKKITPIGHHTWAFEFREAL